jgi:hypothetical protein
MANNSFILFSADSNCFLVVSTVIIYIILQSILSYWMWVPNKGV